MADLESIKAEILDDMMGRFASPASMPIIHTSAGLIARSSPYSAPLAGSAFDMASVFAAQGDANPVDDIITATLTGTGSMNLGLPGAPGVATGPDKYARFFAYKIDVARNETTSPLPFTLNASGRFDADGEAYSLPSVEFAWTPQARYAEQILIFVAEQATPGPRFCLGRLTTSDFPNSFLNNGAANSVAGDRLTINVTAAPANLGFNASIVTQQDASYDVLRKLVWMYCFGYARNDANKAAVRTVDVLTQRGADVLARGVPAKMGRLLPKVGV